ncbi:MFS transporter (plasmid) [Natranaerobius thermophilus JW/NM-WN-LF]
MSAWLAVFVLFGYRATFSVLQGPMAESTGWTSGELSLGYSLMMSIYAITAFLSGYIIDRWGTRPAYIIGAIFACLGFLVTSTVDSYIQYLASYSIFAGIGTGMLWVSSTISVRKWYVGKSYATMWGIAFTGAPAAQVLLSLGIDGVIEDMGWRLAMQLLAIIVLIALLVAGILAKKNPEDYNMVPFGSNEKNTSSKDHHKNADTSRIWSVKEAFVTPAIWVVIIAFLSAMIGEFLIWTQVVNYFIIDANLSQTTATNLYVVIGLAGLVTMPLMGIIADKVVSMVGDETKGRKYMLVFAPAVGIVACLLLLLTDQAIVLGGTASVLFAIYWAIEPGGAAGYAGAVYGQISLGKIWGLSTLIVMGIGPALGSFMGGFLYDLTGSYNNSILFAMGAFTLSTIAACLLPLKISSNSDHPK